MLSLVSQIKCLNMETTSYISALNFSNSIINHNINELRKTLTSLAEFNTIYEEEKSNLPYHINLIDELHADENAHSRILAKLLRYKENGKYLFLESFLTNLCGFQLNIENPKVEKVDSCGRIDIPIFDKEYVVVIENKVTDKAIDQNTDKGGQLARYIETIRENYKRPLESIYVVYTPRYTREPADECWINDKDYSYQDEFESRYCSISYQDKIYPWLKEEILSSISDNDLYLRSAITQYIDYLEGTFKLRAIDKNMNMKLQEYIKKELGLQNTQPEEAKKILSDKKKELENAITQIELLRTEYSKQMMIEQFEHWRVMLEKDFPSMKIVNDSFEIDKNCINVGVKFSIDNEEFVAMIEVNEVNKPNIYVGIGRHYVSNAKHQAPSKMDSIMNKLELTKPDNWWYGWKYTSIPNAYMRLKDLINEIDTIK